MRAIARRAPHNGKRAVLLAKTVGAPPPSRVSGLRQLQRHHFHHLYHKSRTPAYCTGAHHPARTLHLSPHSFRPPSATGEPEVVHCSLQQGRPAMRSGAVGTTLNDMRAPPTTLHSWQRLEGAVSSAVPTSELYTECITIGRTWPARRRGQGGAAAYHRVAAGQGGSGALTRRLPRSPAGMRASKIAACAALALLLGIAAVHAADYSECAGVWRRTQHNRHSSRQIASLRGALGTASARLAAAAANGPKPELNLVCFCPQAAPPPAPPSWAASAPPTSPPQAWLTETCPRWVGGRVHCLAGSQLGDSSHWRPPRSLLHVLLALLNAHSPCPP